MHTLRLAMAQINCTVGDLEGNTKKIIENMEKAREMKADLVSFPELAITGYPPEDLLLKPQFIKDNLQYLQEIVKQSKGTTAVVGFVDGEGDIYNAAAMIHNGSLVGIYHKMCLPNYGVFDEKRYFQVGTEYPVYVLGGITVGVNICEDIWYPEGPAMVQALGGDAEIIVNINSSPYHAEKWKFKEKMLATRAADNSVIVTYNNLVGGQDELVFDGHGMIFDECGNLVARGKQFEEDLILVDLDIEAVSERRLHDARRREEKLVFPLREKVKKIIVSEEPLIKDKPPLAQREVSPPHLQGEVYQALVLGVRDYVWKNGFEKVVVGLSGGIDSALTIIIAVDALGKENVTAVFMPSQYSSKVSEEDAVKVAENLDVRLVSIPIQDTFRAYLDTLTPHFKGFSPDITEENIQARIRGNILMGLSNKFGWLVLSTGNKSELSVGYATLYGDMAGGFAVLKDVPKTLVYKLAEYKNSVAGKDVIPRRVIEKAPTAELKPDQKDEDVLPPYPVLDPILQAYVEEDKSFEEIVAVGFEKDMVAKVIKMVDRSEYKRRQSPPGIKITPRAFGKDRRMPITNWYRS